MYTPLASMIYCVFGFFVVCGGVLGGVEGSLGKMRPLVSPCEPAPAFRLLVEFQLLNLTSSLIYDHAPDHFKI